MLFSLIAIAVKLVLPSEKVVDLESQLSGFPECCRAPRTYKLNNLGPNLIRISNTKWLYELHIRKHVAKKAFFDKSKLLGGPLD